MQSAPQNQEQVCSRDTATPSRFTTAAVAVIMNLFNRPHYVGERALKYENWQLLVIC